ncbi:hypothetical protein D4S03_00540, partial [bacterium]
NNLNIVNQQGIFTWNADPAKPLEQVGNEEFLKENPEEKGYRFCSCYNIKKSLEPVVRKAIEEFGINQEFIYPDPAKISKEIAIKTFDNLSSIRNKE